MEPGRYTPRISRNYLSSPSLHIIQAPITVSQKGNKTSLLLPRAFLTTMLRPFVLLCLSFLVAVRGDVVLFPWTSNDGSFGNAVDAVSGFGNTQPISSSCASALNQTVTCDPQIQLLAASGYIISLNDSSSSLCDPSCTSSLVSYRDAVTSACGASGAFDTYPNTWRADIIYDYFNMVSQAAENL